MNPSGKSISKKILCYLTPAALEHLDNLTKQGLDEDLAVEVLAQCLDEEELFELPPGDSLEPESSVSDEVD